jgi:hypothetical protein
MSNGKIQRRLSITRSDSFKLYEWLKKNDEVFVSAKLTLQEGMDRAKKEVAFAGSIVTFGAVVKDSGIKWVGSQGKQVKGEAGKKYQESISYLARCVRSQQNLLNRLIENLGEQKLKEGLFPVNEEILTQIIATRPVSAPPAEQPK